MYCLVRTLERFCRGATVDADDRGQGPAEVRDDVSVSGVVFGAGEEMVNLAPGDEGWSWKRTQHGTFCYLSGNVILDMLSEVDG